jgi:hypothetical protein
MSERISGTGIRKKNYNSKIKKLHIETH